MAFQTIQVNLEFNANTQRAKAQIADLQSQLKTAVTSMPNSQLSLTPQLQGAQRAAEQLRIALQNATNADTGKLNLTQFQSQLKMSGLTLKQLAGHLQALGPQGVSAFQQLSTVISQANTRMFTLGASAKSFLTSIAHSAKYQLASSMIYGTINAFSKTLDYAKELDTSLNNIRIVTGKNADEMQRFAKEANNAAKTLSTTTTKYTDASLIYYQQGLDDRAVNERTETTVKLANVSGKSAQEVSEWMTAIWNNFDDGSQKLEYYADVLADLGASTASSASEIATGLEKFSAVADTVGLSYEYAASALATITAETRQSADVVGTALKTLFARIEGLKFGDTLEDGTTLNQYSEALSKVGVHIKDANNELKNMDTILSETGMRWNTLSKDQQVALAQSVAGIRQYTQFMALMDNWDVMERNLQITKDANGKLEEQQQIYETSAEAAKRRKDASLEELKTLIVGGEDLSKLYNMIGGFVEVFNDVFESFGGLETIFLGVSAALLKMYQPQVVTMFNNLGIAAQNFGLHAKNFFAKGTWGGGLAYNFQNEALGLANSMLGTSSDEMNTASATTGFNEKNLEMNRLRLEMSNKISASEKQIVDWEMEIIQAQQKQIEQNEQKLQQARALADSKQDEAARAMGVKNEESTRLSTLASTATAVGQAQGHGMYAMNTIEQASQAGTLNKMSRTGVEVGVQKELTAMKASLEEAGVTIDDQLQAKFKTAEEALSQYVDKGKSKLEELKQAMEAVNKGVGIAGDAAIANAMDETGKRVANDSYNQAAKLENTATSNTTSLKDIGEGLDKIDAKKGAFSNRKGATGKQNRETLEALKKENKELQNKDTWMKKNTKSSETAAEKEAKYTKAVKNHRENVKKLAKTTKDGIKVDKSYRAAVENNKGALEEVANANKEAGQSEAVHGQSLDDIGNRMENFINRLKSGKLNVVGFAQTFVSSLQSLASGAMAFSMMTSSAESLGKAFAEGNGSISSWTSGIASALMGMTMMIPVIAKMTGGLNKVIKTRQAINNLTKTGISVEKAKMLMDKKATVEEIANNDKEMQSDLNKALTENAENLGKGPSGWAIFAAAMAGIVAIGAMVGIGISSYNASMQEQEREENDKTIETTEAALDVANGWKEQSQAMDDVIAKHNELSEATNTTIEDQKKLAEAEQAVLDQVSSLVEKYQELDKTYEDLNLSGQIAKLEGAAANNDVEQVEDITNEIDETITRSTSKKAAEGQKAALGNLAFDINEETGDTASNGVVTVHVGDFNDTEGANLLAKKLGVSKDEMSSGWFFGEGAGLDIKLDMNDPQKFKETYEKLREFKTEMEEAGNITDDTYIEVKELLEATSEGYEKLVKLMEDGRYYQMSEVMTSTLKIDPSTISSYEEFKNKKEDFIKTSMKQLNVTREEAETFFDSQKALSAYTLLEKKATALRDKYGKTLQKSMLAYANDLTKEELTAYLKIDFDKFQVEEAWEDLTKMIQAREKGDAIQKDVRSIVGSTKNLKEDGTSEDYQKLQETITWGEKGFIEFSQFLEMSFEEQQTYLQRMSLSASQAALEQYQVELKIAEGLKDKYLDIIKTSKDQKAVEKAKIDLENLEEELEEINVNIALAEQDVASAQKEINKETRERKKAIKSLEEEYNAYQYLDELSKDLTRNMEKLSKAKDRVYGANYINALNAEVKALEAQNQAYDKTIEIANARAEQHKKELMNLGATFDGFGNVSNYNDIQAKYLQELGAIAASQGEGSDAYKAKKEEYDNFKKLADNYNEDLEKAEEAADKKAENIRSILDKKLEGISYTIDIELKINERQLNILQRLLDTLTDDAYDGAERISNATKQADVHYNAINTNKTAIKDTLLAAGVSSEDIDKYMTGQEVDLVKYNLSPEIIDSLHTYTDNIAENEAALRELEETVKEELMTTFDAWHSKIEEQSNLISTQSSILQNYQNIIDTVGKDALGLDDAVMRGIRQANVEIATSAMMAAKAQKETTENALKEVQAKKAAAKAGSDEYKYWEEQEKTLMTQLAEDTDNFTSMWQEAIGSAYEHFEAASQEAIDNLRKAILGISGGMQEALELYNKTNSRYISDYEKAYELNKLNRSLSSELAKTNSVRAQKALRDFQNELNAKQAEGVKLSKHDVELLKQRYNLKLAEIALEDAQNAKSQVRLQKDSEGNFGYVYTADQAKIDETQQKYEDALYQTNKLNEDYLNSLTEQILSNRQEMIDKLAELDASDYATYEEYLQARDELIKVYTDQENYLLSEIQKTLKDNQKIYDEDVAGFSSYVKNQDAIAKTWTFNFNQTKLAIIGDFEDIGDVQSQLTIAIGDGTNTGYTGSMNNAYQDLYTQVSDIMGKMGISMDTFSQAVGLALGEKGAGGATTSFKDVVLEAMYGEDGTAEKPTGGVVKSTKDAEKAATDYYKEATDKFPKAATAVTNWYNVYHPKVTTATKETNDLEQALIGLEKDYKASVSVDLGNSKNDVDALTRAIEGIGAAISKLQNTDFKITAEVKVNIDGYDPNDTKDKNSIHQKDKAEWTTLGEKDSDRKAVNDHMNWNSSFEVVERKSGESYAIYGGHGGTDAIWIDNNALNDVKFTRVNSAVREDQEGNLYVTAKAESSGAGGLIEKGQEYYIPYHYINAWGDSRWAEQETLKSKYAIGAKVNLQGSNGDGQNVFRPGLSFDEIADAVYNGSYTNKESDVANNYDTSRLSPGKAMLPYQTDTAKKNKTHDRYTIIKDSKYKNGTWFYQIEYLYKDMGQTEPRKVTGWIPGVRLQSLDTGGYTGEWGPEGRLAMLHQKEIVLNAHDTENLLSIISMVRDMNDKVEANARAMQYGLTAAYAANNIKSQNDTLQQEVHITAEFPNATNHSEIEEAFRNLTNLASQYANRQF